MIEVEIPGANQTIEFPDDTPPETITRVARSAHAKYELQRERNSNSRYLAGVANIAAEAGQKVFGRISLDGLGRIAGAVATDILTQPSQDVLRVPSMRATAAELMGEPTPPDIQSELDRSPVKRGVVGFARMTPTVGAGMLLPGSSFLTTPLAFAAEGFERAGSEGDIGAGAVEAAKQGAIGAALPVLGTAGRLAGGAATAALVNRGVGGAVLANPAVQKAIETGISQVTVQTPFIAHLMASDEFKNATPAEKRDMLIETVVAQSAFGLPEVVHAFRAPRSAASMFENAKTPTPETEAPQEPQPTLTETSTAGAETTAPATSQPKEPNAIPQQSANEVGVQNEPAVGEGVAGENKPPGSPSGTPETTGKDKIEAGTPEITPATTPTPPDLAVSAGPNQRERTVMAKARVSPEVPKPVQEAVKKDPERFYDPQNVADVAAEVGMKSDAQLLAGMNDKESNTATAHGAEAVHRAIANKDDATASTLISEMAQRGTTLGQLVNQYKLLWKSVPEFTPTIVDKWLKQAGYDPLTDAQRAKITDLARVNIEAEAARRKAEQDYANTPTPEAWQKVSEADAAGQKASLELNEYMAAKHPRLFTDVLIGIFQGNLMSPISQVANIAGNAVRLPLAAPARTMAAMGDAVESALTGKPRTQKVYPIAGTMAKLRALGKASKVAAGILKGGADTANYEAGQHGGVRLNSLRALRELLDIVKGQSDLPTKNGRVPFHDIAEHFIEATFGAPADVMLRMLGAMDAGFRIPERARLINEAALRKGLTPEQAKRAVDRPEMFLPKDELKRIEFEASRSVYQQDNPATKVIAAANQALRRWPWLYALSKTLLPFQKTPTNIIAELLSYTPTGLIKLANDVRTGNRHEANLQAGKLIVGGMIQAGTIWLMKHGLVTPPLDASDESQKTRVGTQDVIPANHINISGIPRVLTGGSGAPQPGDDVRDLTRLGLPGGIMYLTALAMRQAEKGRVGESSFTENMIKNAPTAVATYAMNQTFLQGVSDFVKATQNDQLDSWATKYLTSMASFVVPNTATVVGRAMRDAKPEFRDDDALKAIGNKLNEKANTLGFTVPIGKETKALPLKIDLWGRPMKETPAGANPFVYHFFDVSRARKIPDDPVALELYGLWRRTTDNAVFPSLPDRTLTIDHKKTEPLTWDQYQSLATHVGQARRKITEDLMNIPVWVNLQDDQKLKFLKHYYDLGRRIGESEFITETPNLTPLRPRTGMAR